MKDKTLHNNDQYLELKRSIGQVMIKKKSLKFWANRIQMPQAR